MNYKDFKLDDEANVQSLKILINQCWKTLPIFEGKNRENQVVCTREEAYENYQKHLWSLITKVSGASKMWQGNQYYVELMYMLSGMQDFGIDEHDRVKYIVNHCVHLINSMIKEIINNES